MPSSVRLVSALTDNRSDVTNYLVPISRPSDSLLTAISALQRLWRNSAGMTWQPLGMLTLNGDLSSTRDLQNYPDSTPIGRLAAQSRQSFLGIDAGVERDRTISTSLALTPHISSWLRPRFTNVSSFVLSRFLTSRPLVRANGDSIGAFILPQTLNNTRSREIGGSIDLGRAVRGVFGDSGTMAKLLGRVRPFDVSRRTVMSSTFDLAAFSPSMKYELALGGLYGFLHQQGSDAIGATEAHTTRFSGGADFPLGITGQLSYAVNDVTQYQRVGAGFVRTVITQREWPVGNIRLTHTFASGPLTVLSLATDFRVRHGLATQPDAAHPVTTGTNSSSVSPDAQLSLRNGMSLSLGFGSQNQQTQANGTVTRLTQRDLNGSFNYGFRLPHSLSPQRRLVRSSLTVFRSHSVSCLQRPDDPGCLTTSDVARQEYRAGLDTDVSRTLTGGLQIGYSINDAKQLSTKTSDIFLLLTFQLSLYAGDYR